MIGNFDINGEFTEQELKDLGYTVIVQKWEKNPVSSLFTSNMSGRRALVRKGYIYSIEIDVVNIESTNLTQYLDLNGLIITFLQDTADTITHNMNCEVEPFKHDGKPFYNAVKFKLGSVTDTHETQEPRLSVSKPLKSYQTGQNFIILLNDSDGQSLLKYED